MSGFSRRDFLRIAGLGGIGSGMGFLLGESARNPAARLIPYVIPPEDVIPGVDNWYATLCTQCHAGCGIIVRILEGRAKKIEGNPLHPVNRGRLCARGQAGLQALYNPDRIKGPLMRSGERGDGAFQDISWEKGLSLLSEKLMALQIRGNPEGLCLMTSSVRGHLDLLFNRFMKTFGSKNYIRYDLFQNRNLRFANTLFTGSPALPYYDIANARLILSFGADLGTWISPVNHSLGYGEMRQGIGGSRGRLVQIEPRLSLTGANADEWIPARPGSEGLLALGIASSIIEEGLYQGDDIHEWERLLDDYTPAKAAMLAEVNEKKIRYLAREFIARRPSLALAGDTVSSYENGIFHITAVNILNYLAGNISSSGTVIPNPDIPDNNEMGSARISRFLDEAVKKKIEVLIVNNTNPLFTLPETARLRDALDDIPFIVSLSTFMDETAAMADLLLPAHSYLEAWGDDYADPAVGHPVFTIMQPVVSPVHDTRSPGDIFISVAKGLGGRFHQEMHWQDFLEYLRDSWQQIFEREKDKSIKEARFEDFWEGMLAAGGYWPTETRMNKKAVLKPSKVSPYLSKDLALFEGDADEYPFNLLLYPHPAFFDGRGANLPWLQEMPDPMTSVVWGSWVEMNPASAIGMNIKEGDMVLIESPAGRIHLPVYLYPGTRPDTVCIPIGQGHRTYGRYASGRGVNPCELLPLHLNPHTGDILLNLVRVRISRSNLKGRLVKMEGATKESGRNIVQTVKPVNQGNHS